MARRNPSRTRRPTANGELRWVSGSNNRTPECREHTHMRTNQSETEAEREGEVWANRKSQRGTRGPRGSGRVVQGLVLKRRSALCETKSLKQERVVPTTKLNCRKCLSSPKYHIFYIGVVKYKTKYDTIMVLITIVLTLYFKEYHGKGPQNIISLRYQV